MAKIISINRDMQEREAALVDGMYRNDRKLQYRLYTYCSDYYWDHYKALFFVDEETAGQILQDTHVTLWEMIERRTIYAEDGVVYTCRDRAPLVSSLRTFFMAIARNKFKEYARTKPVMISEEMERMLGVVDDVYDGENIKEMIISDLLHKMPKRCYEIITKFYHEGKSLDVILSEIPEINNKDSLKTKKYKCMENLRDSAKKAYADMRR